MVFAFILRWLSLSFPGLLHVRQVPRLNCLTSNLPDHKDLAFKLKRKQFTIEVHFYSQAFVHEESQTFAANNNLQRTATNSASLVYFFLLLGVKIKGEAIDYMLLLSHLLWCDVRKQQSVRNTSLYPLSLFIEIQLQSTISVINYFNFILPNK